MPDIPTPTQVSQTLPSPYLTGAFTALGERLLPLLSTTAAIPTTTYAQQIAPETQLQQQARGLAGGLGDYQQYLTQAEQYSGPQAYQQFMSHRLRDLGKMLEVKGADLIIGSRWIVS